MAAGAGSRLLETFAKVLVGQRQRYVLSFELSGVGRNHGWHRLEMKVLGQRAA